MAELIFLDLEWNTTFYYARSGERLPFHELIEVAAMKVEEGTGVMLDSFHSYIYPTVSRKLETRTYHLLPYEPEELQELLTEAPGFLDLGPEFLHWCGPDPVFVEWGSNDVEVLLANFDFHQLSFDAGWKCEYYDLQYMYQMLVDGEVKCQPSLEKAVTDLGIETGLDFHSAWNDTYYTVMVYQALLDRFEGMTMFHRPPRVKGWKPMWEAELGSFDTRWGCKNHPDVSWPLFCPQCGEELQTDRWVRTLPTEQVLRCRCVNHRRLYLVLTVEPDGRKWAAKAAIYRGPGPVRERYREAMRKIYSSRRRKKRRNPEQAVG